MLLMISETVMIPRLTSSDGHPLTALPARSVLFKNWFPAQVIKYVGENGLSEGRKPNREKTNIIPKDTPAPRACEPDNVLNARVKATYTRINSQSTNVIRIHAVSSGGANKIVL